jgi:hypothetical protein
VSDVPEIPRAARVFVDFVGLLRANGFAVAPEQTTAFLAGIGLLGPRSLEDVRRARACDTRAAAGAAGGV